MGEKLTREILEDVDLYDLDLWMDYEGNIFGTTMRISTSEVWFYRKNVEGVKKEIFTSDVNEAINIFNRMVGD